MSELVVESSSDEFIVQDKNVPVVGDTTVVAETTEIGKKSVAVQDNNFVLSSSGMYSGSMVGGVPGWLATAITNEVATGTLSIQQLVNDLDLYVKNLEDGINQEITSLNNSDGITNDIITSNKSSTDTALAAISNEMFTKVNEEEALSIAQDVLASEFAGTGGSIAQAFYLNNVSALTNTVEANVNTVNAMVSTITDPSTGIMATADIIQTGYTTVGLNSDGTLSASAGQSEYIAAAIGPQQVSIDSTDEITIDANGSYSAVTSKLITGADGVVSGWTNSNLDGRSDFTIEANTFKVKGSGTGYTPFEIDSTTGKIKFSGNVRFDGLGIDGNSTTIDGGLLEVGSRITAPLIDGGVINGGTINGVNINGSVIKSSWIDYTTTGGLTNWQYYTPSTVPSSYVANFAHDNSTGDLIVDSEGYVRLPTTVPLLVPGAGNSNSFSGETGTISIGSSTQPLYAWNSYTVNNAQRFLDKDGIFFYPSETPGTSIHLVYAYGKSTGGAIGNTALVANTDVSFMGTTFDLHFEANGNNGVGKAQFTKDGSYVLNNSFNAADGSGGEHSYTWNYTVHGVPLRVYYYYAATQDINGFIVKFYVDIVYPSSGTVSLSNYVDGDGNISSTGSDVGIANNNTDNLEGNILCKLPVMKFI